MSPSREAVMALLDAAQSDRYPIDFALSHGTRSASTDAVRGLFDDVHDHALPWTTSRRAFLVNELTEFLFYGPPDTGESYCTCTHNSIP